MMGDTRLVIRGLMGQRIFDVKPPEYYPAASFSHIYLTLDQKYVVKIVDSYVYAQCRAISNHFESRLVSFRRNSLAEAEKMGLDIECLHGAVSSWEKTLPFDFGPVYLEGKSLGYAIVENHLPGYSLKESLKLNMRLGLHEVKQLIRRLFCEVAILHRTGIVHMDLTPPNIILNESRSEIYVIDLDLAQISESPVGAVSVIFPNTTVVPLPPGFDPMPKGSRKLTAPHTFFDVWYLPVDVLCMIAAFDGDMRRLFGGGSPSPMFFIDFPTIDKLSKLKRHLEGKGARRTWPPDYDILKDFEYLTKKVKKEHLDIFRDIVGRYVNPELFYCVYLDALGDGRRPNACDLQRFVRLSEEARHEQAAASRSGQMEPPTKISIQTSTQPNSPTTNESDTGQTIAVEMVFNMGVHQISKGSVVRAAIKVQNLTGNKVQLEWVKNIGSIPEGGLMVLSVDCGSLLRGMVFLSSFMLNGNEFRTINLTYEACEIGEYEISPLVSFVSARTGETIFVALGVIRCKIEG